MAPPLHAEPEQSMFSNNFSHQPLSITAREFTHNDSLMESLEGSFTRYVTLSCVLCCSGGHFGVYFGDSIHSIGFQRKRAPHKVNQQHSQVHFWESQLANRTGRKCSLFGKVRFQLWYSPLWSDATSAVSSLWGWLWAELTPLTVGSRSFIATESDDRLTDISDLWVFSYFSTFDSCSLHRVTE